MDDGEVPIANWQSASYAVRYDAVIRNVSNVIVCSQLNLPASVKQIIFPANCFLRLNDNYTLQVTAYDSGGTPRNAANGPYAFTHRVGLYLSGDPSSRSYYKGKSITTCGGTGSSVCDASFPYRVSSKVDEIQIRMQNNAVMTGVAWTSGQPIVGNGVLDVKAKYLKIESNSRIHTDKLGYTPGNGPGAGIVGAQGGGGSHGGYAGGVNSLPSGVVYGNVNYPDAMGSGGGNASDGTPAGKGGGIIVLDVYEELSVNNGYISANGEVGVKNPNSNSPYGGGGGAGGSVRIINLKNLVGSGLYIETVGGNSSSWSEGGSGSGGRIAMYYDNLSAFTGGFNAINFKPYAGNNANTGTSGTVFYKQTNDFNGYVMADNGTIPYRQGMETPLPLYIYDGVITKNSATFIIPSTDTFNLQGNSLNFRVAVAGAMNVPLTTAVPTPVPQLVKHLIIDANGYMDWRRVNAFDLCDELTIENGGVLTHSPNKDTMSYYLNMTLNKLTLNGGIDVTGKGYEAGKGPGAASGNHAASYGGYGAYNTASPGGSYNPPYGNIANPTELGSGGKNTAGGGRVKLKVNDTFTMNPTGYIKANGAASGNTGGSGGSIYIDAANIVWNEASPSTLASVTAQGSDLSAGGAGGRIAVLYTSILFSNATEMDLRAYGGWGSLHGAAGTIFVKGLLDIFGRLIVNNSTRTYYEKITTPIMDSAMAFDSIKTDGNGTVLIPQGMIYEIPSALMDFRLVAEGQINLPLAAANSLELTSGGYLEWRKSSKLTLTNLTVGSGAVLTHTSNTTSPQYSLWLDINNDLNLTGLIHANGKGYSPNGGPGVPIDAYSGAAYAGYGGMAWDNNRFKPQNSPYATDSIRTPTELGSGSRNNGSVLGASGGGALRIGVGGNFNLSGGTLRADGLTPTNGGGGGAAGSIWIDANHLELALNSLIRANGGDGGSGTTPAGSGSNSMGCGSGGRISINYNTTNVADWKTEITGTQIQSWGGSAAACNSNGGIPMSRAGAAGTIFVLDKDDASMIPGHLYAYNHDVEYVPLVDTPVDDAFTPKSFQTPDYLGVQNSRLVVLPSQSLNLPSADIDYAIAVEGLVNMSSGTLSIANKGIFEWRRSNAINLDHLIIKNGAVLTHQNNFVDHIVQLKLVLNDLNIETGGMIDVSGRGYQNSQGPGGVAGGAGAYGGNATKNLAYGSITEPINLGSGGTGGRGGGMAHIVVANKAILNGTIKANGSSSTSGANTAGGSGGSVFLNTQFLEGTSGTITTHGGNGFLTGEGGSGGRIAILYDDDSAYIPTGIGSLVKEAYGGMSTTSALIGAAGTVYYKNKLAPGSNGHLIIANNPSIYNENLVTPVRDGLAIDSLTIDDQSRLLIPLGSVFQLPTQDLAFHLIMEGDLIVSGGSLNIKNKGILEMRRADVLNLSDLNIESGGVLTHSKNLDLKKYWVNLHLSNNLNLLAGGEINVDGKGYSSDNGLGRGVATAPGLNRPGGGSYAGKGNPSQSSSWTQYGSLITPLDLGSGGGSVSSVPVASGGAGGGIIELQVDNEFRIDGKILSNGTDGVTTGTCIGGGGAGGSIKIQSHIISGSGFANTGVPAEIRAQGGSGAGAHGGGGRIAITYDLDQFPIATGGSFNPENVTDILFSTTGGTGPSIYNGAAGTLLLKDLSQHVQAGHLYIDNKNFYYNEGVETVLSAADSFDQISIGTSVLGSQSTAIKITSTGSLSLSSSNLNFPIVLAGNLDFPNADLNIKQGGKLIISKDALLVLHDLTIENGGFVSHQFNSNVQTQTLKLKMTGKLDLQAGGMIDVSGRGFASANGTGRGYGDGVLAGSGAGHGGYGGGSVTGVALKGNVYDSAVNPVFIGSGGGRGVGASCTLGGAGGGYIYLEVLGDAIIAGDILANGMSPTCNTAGAGSGGSIVLIANQFLNGSVPGNIRANGGNVPAGASNGGGGGGGLVYIQTLLSNTFSGLIESQGGSAQSDRQGLVGNVTISP
jgi:hypothetical protein